jgi:hypothetical protein
MFTIMQADTKAVASSGHEVAKNSSSETHSRTLGNGLQESNLTRGMVFVLSLQDRALPPDLGSDIHC